MPAFHITNDNKWKEVQTLICHRQNISIASNNVGLYLDLLQNMSSSPITHPKDPAATSRLSHLPPLKGGSLSVDMTRNLEWNLMTDHK